MLYWITKQDANRNTFYDLSRILSIWHRYSKNAGKRAKLCGDKYFTKEYKRYEYPVIFYIIEQFYKIYGYWPKVMDFGCWLSPLPELLGEVGCEVWGVDNDEWGDLKNLNIQQCNTHVNYFIDNIYNLQEHNFDIIYSSSVLEHFSNDTEVIELLRYIKTLLSSSGIQFHSVDVYIKKRPSHCYRNFKQILDSMGWKYDECVVPYAGKDWKNVKNKAIVGNDEFRVIIGQEWKYYGL